MTALQSLTAHFQLSGQVRCLREETKSRTKLKTEEQVQTGLKIPPCITSARRLRWSRPFGQFCGLDKLYPVVVMPPF
ncbi:hypothetical protein CFR78_15680 [Komagataeibacter rhaeticus]|nr:hypothetical protein CFR78_15680 [Komagataeibacter rhaeticus]